MFRVADAVADGRLLVWLDPAWNGWENSGATVEIQVNDSKVIPISPNMAGLHTISGLANGKAIRIRVRGQVDGQAGEWSEALEAIATASTFERFSVWADGFHTEPLKEQVMAIGRDRASPDLINKPLKLASGSEIEYIGGPNSLFAKNFAYNSFKDVKRPGETAAKGEKVLPETRHRHFEPGGNHHDLAPLETYTERFVVRTASDNADRMGEVVILGRCGAYGQLAMSIMGLDPKNNPVAFRFDRVSLAGWYPDGTAWVQGPVRLLHNGGAPVEVATGTVVEWRGAILSVVERPGLIPSRRQPRQLELSSRYVRHAGTWSAPQWGQPARQKSGFTIHSQYETLHLYLRSANTTPTEVRFREVGEDNWHPAMPLRYDWRPANVPVHSTADMDVIMPGNHRGVLLHLAPGTDYQVQVKQGDVYWEATASTRDYRAKKVREVAVGTIRGDFVIEQGGTPEAYVEYHSGRIIGGQIKLNASHVILRDIDVLGAPKHGIVLSPGIKDVRIIRGRIAGWSESDIGKRPKNVGWGVHCDSAIFCGIEPATVMPHDVAVIGTQFGSPRFPSNSWQEWNPSVGDSEFLTTTHPWGPQVITPKTGIYKGFWTVSDVSITAHPLRSYNDALGGDYNNGPRPGGFGPNFVFSYNYIAGAADDGIEHEGACQVGVILGNFFDSRRVRPFTRGQPAGIGLAANYYGPTYLVRNIFLRHSPEGWVAHDPAREMGFTLKIKRGEGKFPDVEGYIYLLHNTIYSPSTQEAFRNICPGGKEWGGYLHGANNLVLINGTLYDKFPGEDFTWSKSNLYVNRIEEFPALLPGTHLPLSAQGITRGEFIPNINDGGPFGSAEGTLLLGAGQHLPK